jgi:hypothetical protein
MFKGGGSFSYGSLEGDDFSARAGRAAEGFSDPDSGADMLTLVFALRDERVSEEKRADVRQRLAEVLGSF